MGLKSTQIEPSVNQKGRFRVICPTVNGKYWNKVQRPVYLE